MHGEEQKDKVEGRALARVPVEQRDLLEEAGDHIGKVSGWKHGIGMEVARELLQGLRETEGNVGALNQSERAEKLLVDIREINGCLLGHRRGLIAG
jgi:hypothetical protein